MKPVPLALDDIPPFRVPLRFYLTAPVFGAAAGVMWLSQGEFAFQSRWMNGTLAATHLLTLGFLAMVMLGSLFQVVPVLGGGAIPAARRIAPLVHAGLVAGTVCLVIGLDGFSPGWLGAALVLLAIAFGTFVALLAWRILRPSRGGDALFTIRLALLCLIATIVIGGWMAIGIARPEAGIRFRDWTDAHASFGLGGWVLLLIMGVGYQVVPMFHVTPPFPSWLVRGVGSTVFAGLCVLGVTRDSPLATLAATGVTLAGLVWAIGLLVLLSRRRRRRAEPAVRAWQFAAVALVIALLLTWKIVCLPDSLVPGVPAHQTGMLAAVLFGFGFAITVVFGMLGKIVPFLSFTHLQRRCLVRPAAIPLLPAMNRILSDRAARWQLRLHWVAVLGVVLAVCWPPSAPWAAGLVVLDFAHCFVNVATAAVRYRRASLAISGVEASPAAT
jgi:hypothetical protein